MKVPLGQAMKHNSAGSEMAPPKYIALLLCNSSLTITQNVLSSFHVFFTVTSQRRPVKVLSSNLLSSIKKNLLLEVAA